MTRATHDRFEMLVYTVAYACIGCSAALLQPNTVMAVVLAVFYVILTPLLPVVAWATWRSYATKNRRKL